MSGLHEKVLAPRLPETLSRRFPHPELRNCQQAGRQAGRQASRQAPIYLTDATTRHDILTLSHQHCRRLPKAIPPLWRRKLLLLSWTSMLAPMPRALLRSTPLTIPQRHWLLETRLRRQRLSFVRLSDRYCHQSGRSSRWQLGLWPTCRCK